LYRKVHETIKRVTQDTETFRFNTAIAALMELLNELVRYRAVTPASTPLFAATAQVFARLLSPFAPHLAEELHARLGGSSSIYDATWPAWDEAALAVAEVEIVLQVNGKVRGKLVLPAGTGTDALTAAALAHPRVAAAVADRPIRTVVTVVDRLVNVVV
jgi:leucyl-tRNA synthetase